MLVVNAGESFLSLDALPAGKISVNLVAAVARDGVSRRGQVVYAPATEGLAGYSRDRGDLRLERRPRPPVRSWLLPART